MEEGESEAWDSVAWKTRERRGNIEREMLEKLLVCPSLFVPVYLSIPVGLSVHICELISDTLLCLLMSMFPVNASPDSLLLQSSFLACCLYV